MRFGWKNNLRRRKIKIQYNMKNTLPERFWIQIYNEDHWNLVVKKLGELGWTFPIPVSFREGRCISNREGDKDGCLGWGNDGMNFYPHHEDDYGKAISTDLLLSCAPNKKINVVLNSVYT